MLEDGTYDGIIVDASIAGDADDADDADGGSMRVEIAISTGPHKGEVVAIRGAFPGLSEVDLLAAPATIVVVDGRPAVTLDD